MIATQDCWEVLFFEVVPASRRADLVSASLPNQFVSHFAPCSGILRVIDLGDFLTASLHWSEQQDASCGHNVT